MALSLETDMSSVVLLCTILIQGVFGTFFPPVDNPPPIPGQSVRILENSPEGFYVQENVRQDFSPPLEKEGLFSTEEKIEGQRWYFEENPSGETGQVQDPTDEFERYYQSGEPAVGPVATPIPDDAYLRQLSSLSKLNPNEASNSGILLLTRGSDNQYIPDRWIQVRLPQERFVEVVNQDPGAPLATDTVKSFVGPLQSEVPIKPQFTASTLANIIQQIWVRSPDALGSQVLKNPPDIVEEVPSVKQIVEIPAGNLKQVVQQQVVKDASPATLPLPGPASPPLLSKKSFTAPPPPPPPLKGFDPITKNGPPVAVNVIPDSKIVVNDNGPFRQIRHIWVATSPTTGKFISFSVPTPVNSGKSIVNSDISLDSTPIAVSDTWVLKQEGPIPSFEQRKSLLPPPEIQSGKTLFQDPSIIKADAPSSPAIVAQIGSSKNPTGKSVGLIESVDIWPAKQDIANLKPTGKFSGENLPQLVPASPKSAGIIAISNTLPVSPLAPQKTVTNSKSLTPPILPPPAKVVNGKPCPLPLPPQQKYLLSPRSPNLIAIPRIISASRRPVARIVRVNRYPSGSYYLLNNRIRPSYFIYPNSAQLKQPTSQFLRLIQPNQIPFTLQSKQSAFPLQTKQIQVPPQQKLSAPIPAKQVFPFRATQTILPASYPKSSRVIYPAQQPIKYIYPWNGYSNYGPIPGKGLFVSQYNSQDTPLSLSASDSSSESSSDSSSSEAENKKLKKEEKSTSEDSDSSGEIETESSSEESKDASSEVKSNDESIEAAESQISHHREIFDADGATTVYHQNHPETSYRFPIHSSAIENIGTNEPGAVTYGNDHPNLISNDVTNSEEKNRHGSERFINDMTTSFIRD